MEGMNKELTNAVVRSLQQMTDNYTLLNSYLNTLDELDFITMFASNIKNGFYESINNTTDRNTLFNFDNGVVVLDFLNTIVVNIALEGLDIVKVYDTIYATMIAVIENSRLKSDLYYDKEDMNKRDFLYMMNVLVKMYIKIIRNKTENNNDWED